MSNQKNSISDNDLIFYSSGEKIYSGGFSLDSILMREGLSAIQSVNHQSGGTFNGLFGKNYVVPPMWFLSPFDSQEIGGRENHDERSLEPETIEEDLHDKLLGILEAGGKTSKKKTNKLREKNTKRTTKRKMIYN